MIRPGPATPRGWTAPELLVFATKPWPTGLVEHSPRWPVRHSRGASGSQLAGPDWPRRNCALAEHGLGLLERCGAKRTRGGGRHDRASCLRLLAPAAVLLAASLPAPTPGPTRPTGEQGGRQCDGTREPKPVHHNMPVHINKLY